MQFSGSSAAQLSESFIHRLLIGVLDTRYDTRAINAVSQF
jgi:hypothetical protein